jgi:hypothetical protein
VDKDDEASRNMKDMGQTIAWLGAALHQHTSPIDAEEITPLVAHVSEFCGQDHLATAASDGTSDQPLVFAAAVHVRRVEKGHPESERMLDRGDGFLVIARAVEL